MRIHKTFEESFWRGIHYRMKESIGRGKFSNMTGKLRYQARQEWDLWQIITDELDEFVRKGL